MAGMGYGAGKPAKPEMKDLASAIEEAPAEVEGSAEEEIGEGELDAEQASLAEQMGLTPEQGVALRSFIETML